MRPTVRPICRSGEVTVSPWQRPFRSLCYDACDPEINRVLSEREGGQRISQVVGVCLHLLQPAAPGDPDKQITIYHTANICSAMSSVMILTIFCLIKFHSLLDWVSLRDVTRQFEPVVLIFWEITKGHLNSKRNTCCKDIVTQTLCLLFPV